MKLIKRSSYAVALMIHFLSLSGETKESTIFFSEDQLFENKEFEVDKAIYQFKDNKYFLNSDNFLIAEETKQKDNNNKTEEKRVLISEIIIEGLEGHPDKDRLEVVAYDAMLIRPGSKVTSHDVKKDLDRIYSSGWFSGARIESLKTALGVRLLIKVDPNPILNQIKIIPIENKLSNTKLDEIFNEDYGKTLNLNTLQIRIKEIKDWYNFNGYSLARISGPSRVTKEVRVELHIKEGYISGIEINFIDEDGNKEDEKGRLIK